MAETTLLNVMWLLIISLLMAVLRLLCLYLKTIKKIQYYNNEAIYFDKMNNIEETSLSKINESISDDLKKLEILKKNTIKEDKQKIEDVINDLFEIHNNIDVLVNSPVENNIRSYNIEKEINSLIKKLAITDKVEIHIEKEINNLRYDNLKIVSALKLILLETLKNDMKKINVFISMLDNSKLIIKLENINLFKKYDKKNSNRLKKFFKHNNYSQYLDIHISPELYMIRANLIWGAEKVYFNNNDMIIEIAVKNKKD